jgi:hypothetical protein
MSFPLPLLYEFSLAAAYVTRLGTLPLSSGHKFAISFPLANYITNPSERPTEGPYDLVLFLVGFWVLLIILSSFPKT